MRYNSKVDDNQKEIVEALRGAGAKVIPLHQVGRGIPDLLVGYRGDNFLIEVKGKKGKLTKPQIKFFGEWRGKANVCRNAEQALMVIGEVKM